MSAEHGNDVPGVREIIFNQILGVDKRECFYMYSIGLDLG